jgi:hypothetical protein
MVKVLGGNKIGAYLNEIIGQLGTDPTVRIGVVDDASYPDGTPVTTAAIANEYGTATIPPRPAVRVMIDEKQEGWTEQAKQLLVANGYYTHETLDQMGAVIAGDMTEAIKQGYPPPNAPSTIKKKGFDHPLTDTGQLANSVSWEVQK